MATKSLSAHVNFLVSDFDNDTITWSLKVVVSGVLGLNNRTGAYMDVQVKDGNVNSVVPTYEAEYDKTLNQTTLIASFYRTPLPTYGSFPNENRFFLLYFGLNATVSTNSMCDTLPLPTQNYSGLSCVGLAKSNGLLASGYDASLDVYGSVYFLTAQIQRTYYMSIFLTTAMVTVPNALWALFDLLAFVLPLQLGIDTLAWLRSSQSRNLLNANYFAIAIGLLFFLPIYALSLRPYEAPITLTTGDVSLFKLLLYVAYLLLVALPVSWLSSTLRWPTRRRQTPVRAA
jgi:hypothetical protein